MAYTTPRTWVDETLVDAADLNAEIRDNVSALYSMAAYPSRNLLQNGQMQVSQRGLSSAGNTATGVWLIDRWRSTISSLGTWTESRETDAPANTGLRTSLKMLCTTANAAPAAGGVFLVRQILEGYDVQRIKKGTASAEQLTLSFWVKANVTGTFIVELEDQDNTRYCSATYTVNASATWEQKTITFPADTTGAFDNDENGSLALNFWLGAGTNFTSGTLGTTWHTTTANRAVGGTNVAATLNNYWQLTGVQLETGTVATPFEFLPYGDELRRCQRYYYLHASGAAGPIGMGSQDNAGFAYGQFQFPVTMRAASTTLDQTTGASYFTFFRNNTTAAATSLTWNAATNQMVEFYSALAGTAGHAGFWRTSNASARLAINVEL